MAMADYFQVMKTLQLVSSLRYGRNQPHEVFVKQKTSTTSDVLPFVNNTTTI